MTRVFAEAHVATDQARRHLAELCGAFEPRAQAKPDRSVSVEWSDNDGTIDLGWARCTIHAEPTALVLRADAQDDDALAQMCELITRHLKRHTGDLTITWLRDGAPLGAADPRQTMRAFHRRMRHR